MYDEVAFEILGGTTLVCVEIIDEDRELIFTLDSGEKYRLWHRQECCENVYIENICGDLNDLIGTPILMAEASSNSDEMPTDIEQEQQLHCAGDDGFTWTFYRIGTAKGTVVIRWYGTSNGYYSEGVDFARI